MTSPVPFWTECDRCGIRYLETAGRHVSDLLCESCFMYVYVLTEIPNMVKKQLKERIV